MRHWTPKERVNIIQPRAELHSWTDRAGVMSYRIDIDGQPLTMAYLRARFAWAAALTTLRASAREELRKL